MTIDRPDIEELNKRLGVVIALLLKGIPKDGDGISLREQVDLLAQLGVRPRDIAEILSRSQKYVTKELASLRKMKRKTGKHG